MDLLSYKPEKAFSNKHLLTLKDLSKDEILQILSVSLKIKQNKTLGENLLKNKKLAMIFAKSSTRTRVSFEVGTVELGGYPLILNANDMQLGRGETISDTAQVLSRMVDGIMIRTFDQTQIEDLAQFGSIPIINGLTDDYHPCQILADFLTIYEHFGTLENLKLTYMGDSNNMSNSYMIGCAKIGMDCSVACPKEDMPDPEIIAYVESIAKQTGAIITVTNNVKEAVSGSNILCTDVWSSMGQASLTQKDFEKFLPYQINEKAMSMAADNAILLHCLPAHRGEEVSAGVIDSPASYVFDEAENRLHAQKGVLAVLMGNKEDAIWN